MSDKIILPAVLDVGAAAALKTQIQARQGSPLELDASNVERVGGLCLQLLLGAAAASSRGDLALRILNASQAFRDDVQLMGAADLLPKCDEGSAEPC